MTLLLLFLTSALACTDILVTPGASVDGSAIVAYNADSPTLFGSIYHYPAESHVVNGTLRKIYDWDSGVYLGEIPEAHITYNVVGNSNEFGLVIGESTFGGVKELEMNQPGAIIDYGSLIYLTLQRSKTVQEAIRVMVDLMDTYGYYSAGESFSLMDSSGDVWMMEVIGRGDSYPGLDGKPKKGAVWVAQRIPDGMVAAHANQARITTFSRDDPENCLFAPDVVDVAVHYGLYPKEADPLKFSFSDVYNPVNFIGARQGEARVWSIFSGVTDLDGEFQHQYQLYATGQNLTRRMPLYVKPIHKLSLRRVMHLMTSHYEDTVMDSAKDVGSGLFGSPYRPRPLVWTIDGDENKTMYHNERSVATPKTGWSFVAQTRPWMPQQLSTISWYAMDDSSTAPRLPIYSSSYRVPPAYAGKGSQDGIKTPLLQFDMTKAFWVQNMVSNLCYSRWADIYPELRNHIDVLQNEMEKEVAAVDHAAVQFNTSFAAIEYVTQFSERTGQAMHQKWLTLYGELFVKFRDFYTIEESKNAVGAKAKEPGMSNAVKKRIVMETGAHYRVLENDSHHPDDSRQM